MAVTLLRGPGVSRAPSLSNGNKLWEVGSPSGLPRTGLVALYDPYRSTYGLDEAGRAALQVLTDYSGRGNHGTLGADTNASTDDPAFTGTALSFDGGDYVGVGSILGITDARYVTSFAVLTVPADSAGKVFTISGGNGGEQFFQYRFGASPENVDVGGKIMIQVCVSGVWSYCLTNDALTFPKTFVLAISRNGTAGTIMVNGVRMATTGDLSADNGAVGSASYVGRGDGGNPLFFTGSIHHLSVFNRSMSIPELTRASLYLKSLMAGRGVTVA